MPGHLFDTSVISPLLDSSHSRHRDVRVAVEALGPESTSFTSVTTIAELGFGVRLAETVFDSASPHLRQVLTTAYGHAVLEVTRHTADAYAELKATLAGRVRCSYISWETKYASSIFNRPLPTLGVRTSGNPFS